MTLPTSCFPFLPVYIYKDFKQLAVSDDSWKKIEQWIISKWKISKQANKPTNPGKPFQSHKLPGGFWCVPKWKTGKRRAFLLSVPTRAKISTPSQGPRTVRSGHGWPQEWTLPKKTLWRYPFWWLNRLSLRLKQIQIKKKKHWGKAIAHGTLMIKCLQISATHCRHGPFSWIHSYSRSKL